MAGINDKPCNTCLHYDPIVRGGNKPRTPSHGWCSVKSVYPTVQPESRIFPIGVQRAPDGEMAKPVIVRRLEVVSHCAQFRAKPTL